MLAKLGATCKQTEKRLDLIKIILPLNFKKVTPHCTTRHQQDVGVTMAPNPHLSCLFFDGHFVWSPFVS